MAESSMSTISMSTLKKLASGYDVADRTIRVNSTKGRALSQVSDGVENYSTVGMLSAQVKQFSRAAGVSVEINNVKKEQKILSLLLTLNCWIK